MKPDVAAGLGGLFRSYALAIQPRPTVMPRSPRMDGGPVEVRLRDYGSVGRADSLSTMTALESGRLDRMGAEFGNRRASYPC
jgi:hypothetical protein